MKPHRNRHEFFCTNCGEMSHTNRECKHPITSIGLLLFKQIEGLSHFVMVRRRNTIGYVQLIRGKYSFYDPQYIQSLCNVLTNYEVELLQTRSFDGLWEHLWNEQLDRQKQSQYDYRNAKDKFLRLKQGVIIHQQALSLSIFLKRKHSSYPEQEWGFPKGRRKQWETERQTACRECFEETGILGEYIRWLDDEPLVEQYRSYDNVMYRNIYLLAEYTGESKQFDVTSSEQKDEISEIRLVKAEEGIQLLRDYEQPKAEVLRQAQDRIQKSQENVISIISE